ncbi:MAG: hypothetical protein WC393_02785 [Candidatus Nanoarchaeia archaeon]|jgi:hypothetical protein
MNKIIISFLILALMFNASYAAESNLILSTDKIFPNDVLSLNVIIPYEDSTCITSLISPKGEIIFYSEGQCGKFSSTYCSGGYNLHCVEYDNQENCLAYGPDMNNCTQYTTQNITITKLADIGGFNYILDSYGNWTVQVEVVLRSEQEWVNEIINSNERIDDYFKRHEYSAAETLTANFSYAFKNRIFGYCLKMYNTSKTCSFLGTDYTIENIEGCGSNAKVRVTFNGFVKNLNVGSGSKVELNNGIFTRLNSVPCMGGVYSFNFEYEYDESEDIGIYVSPQDNGVSAIMEGVRYALPMSEKGEPMVETIIGKELSEISVNLENDSLTLNIGNASAEIELPLNINSSTLYAESKNESIEINMLPDNAIKISNDYMDSVETIKLEEGSAIYSIIGIKSSKILGILPQDMEVTIIINANTEDIESVIKPWWNILAW